MRVSARAGYACLAMMELARSYANSKPIRLTEITSKHLIPHRFLVQIMLQMKAAGLVTTTRGSTGGYRLARSPESITLADILSVLDRIGEPELPEIGDSPMSRKLEEVWRELAESRNRFLQQISLRDLVPTEVAIDYVI